MPVAQAPFIADNVLVTLAGKELTCLVNHVEITPDVSDVEITSMCGRKTYPGAVEWQFNATFYQSFDVDGTDAVLGGAVAGGVPVPFIVQARGDAPISATNPSFTGMVIPKPYTLIAADAGEATTVDIEWSIDGEPVKDITPGP